MVVADEDELLAGAVEGQAQLTGGVGLGPEADAVAFAAAQIEPRRVEVPIGPEGGARRGGEVND